MSITQRYLNAVVNRDMNKDSDAGHEYLDITIINNNPRYSAPIPLTFVENREMPIIHDPDQYYLSVIRFELDTTSLPQVIPQVLTGQSDPNKLIYSFTMVYKTFEFQQYVEFVPQDQTAPVPGPPTSVQDLSTSYYHLNSYGYFVKLLNTALENCFTGLQEIVVAGEETLPTTNAHFLIYDPNDLSLIFNLDVAGFESSLDDPIEVYFNVPMQNLISSFNMQTVQYGQASGKNYKLIVDNMNNTNIYELVSYNCIQLLQEYNTVSMWNCIQSIVLCSSNIPLRPSMEASPFIFGSPISLVNSNYSLQVPTISDFQVSSGDYKPYVAYTAGGQYRLIDLYGHNPITQISIEVYYKDIYGNLKPLLIPSNSSSNIKIMFRKKHLGV